MAQSDSGGRVLQSWKSALGSRIAKKTAERLESYGGCSAAREVREKPDRDYRPGYRQDYQLGSLQSTQAGAGPAHINVKPKSLGD